MSDAPGIREFLKGPTGKAIAVGLTLVAVALAAWSVASNVGPTDAESLASKRWFVDAETGKGFTHTVVAGDTVPLTSPFTGKKTAYPAELCYWTKDGSIKNEPTPVLMNYTKGVSGPTFCPDCGRLVVPYNPRPSKGDPAPLTQQQYAARPKGMP